MNGDGKVFGKTFFKLDSAQDYIVLNALCVVENLYFPVSVRGIHAKSVKGSIYHATVRPWMVGKKSESHSDLPVIKF